ncbi:MAG TPA: hypothetical protein VM074_05340 [Solimonas sp.]|nr:hypothetical protein [Solimonas sp.]
MPDSARPRARRRARKRPGNPRRAWWPFGRPRGLTPRRGRARAGVLAAILVHLLLLWGLLPGRASVTSAPRPGSASSASILLPSERLGRELQLQPRLHAAPAAPPAPFPRAAGLPKQRLGFSPRLGAAAAEAAALTRLTAFAPLHAKADLQLAPPGLPIVAPLAALTLEEREAVAAEALAAARPAAAPEAEDAPLPAHEPPLAPAQPVPQRPARPRPAPAPATF